MTFFGKDPHKFKKKSCKKVLNHQKDLIQKVTSISNFWKNIPKMSQGLIQFEPWLVVSNSVGLSFKFYKTK
jgi:hypothetical protein